MVIYGRVIVPLDLVQSFGMIAQLIVAVCLPRGVGHTITYYVCDLSPCEKDKTCWMELPGALNDKKKKNVP